MKQAITFALLMHALVAQACTEDPGNIIFIGNKNVSTCKPDAIFLIIFQKLKESCVHRDGQNVVLSLALLHRNHTAMAASCKKYCRAGAWSIT